MIGAWRRVALVALLSSAPARPASAQTTAYLGGGALVPTEGFADVADVGYLVTGGLRKRVASGSRLSLGLEGFYGRASHGLPGERSDLYGASALVGYTLYTGDPLAFELSAEVSGLSHAHKSKSFPGLDSTRSGLALGAAATIWAHFGGVRPFVRGGYARGVGGLASAAFPTRWVGLSGGLAIPLG